MPENSFGLPSWREANKKYPSNILLRQRTVLGYRVEEKEIKNYSKEMYQLDANNFTMILF